MIEPVRQVPRNAALLLMLLVLILLAPMLRIERSWWLVEVIFDLILLAGVYSVGPGRHRWPFSVLTVLTLAARWSEFSSGMRSLDIPALTLTAIWISYAVSIVVSYLFRRRQVTLDTILGAVVAYLLAAVGFSMLFQILEIHEPGSFSGLPDMIHRDRLGLQGWMVYFSLVCITTMGYGDIVPVSDMARPLAVIEGAFGQFYLAVMIARLVGLHLVNEDRK